MDQQLHANSTIQQHNHQPVRNQLVTTERAYLEVIFYLSNRGEAIRATRLAQWLRAQPSDVIKVLRRLEHKEMIMHTPSGEIALTPDGKHTAHALVRQQRLVACFLFSILQVPWHFVQQEAVRLAPLISPVMAERIVDLVGDVQTCPYGNPIPDTDILIEATVRLHTVPPGTQFTILRIDEEASADHEMLHLLYVQGLTPGTSVVVIEQHEPGQVVIVRSTTQQCILSHHTAAFLCGECTAQVGYNTSERSEQ